MRKQLILWLCLLLIAGTAVSCVEYSELTTEAEFNDDDYE